MSERGRDPGDGSNWRMFPANKKPRRTPVNTNLSLLPSRRAEDGQGGAEEENAAAAQQATGGGVESRTLDLISAINRPAGTSSADHAGPRTLDLISEIGRTGTSSSNDQAGGGDGQGRGSAPPPPQGGNALSHARSAPNAMGPGIFSVRCIGDMEGEMDGRGRGKQGASACSTDIAVAVVKSTDALEVGGACRGSTDEVSGTVGGDGASSVDTSLTLDIGATATRVWRSNSQRASQQTSDRDAAFPFLRDARKSMLSQRPQRQGDGKCGHVGQTAEQHTASCSVQYPVGCDGGLVRTGMPQAAQQQQHQTRRTQHEPPIQDKMAEVERDKNKRKTPDYGEDSTSSQQSTRRKRARTTGVLGGVDFPQSGGRGSQSGLWPRQPAAEGGGVEGGHIGTGTGRPDELALRRGTAPDVVPPRPSQQPSDAAGGLNKSCRGHPSGLLGKVPALGQQALEGTGGNPTQDGMAKDDVKDRRFEYDIARANRAIHRAVGEYAPAIRLDQLLQPPAEAQPPRLASSVQQQIHDALQLNQGAVQQRAGSTVQEINDADGPYVPQVRPEAINAAAAAGQLVPASAATAVSDPLPQPEPEPEPQPTGTCPRCRTGPGTVSLHHLCQCRECPDMDRPCPFCALVAVPKLERPVKTEEGSCPFCRSWPGVAKAGHICLCWLCQEIPDAGCRYCTLKDLPLPEPQLDGKCPCCTENQGRVAIQHLCLCEGCKGLPDALCPFCLLAEGCVPILAFSVLVLYSLSMW